VPRFHKQEAEFVITKPMAKNPDRNTTDGMIVTVDDVGVWDGEGEQLGLPSLVGRKSPVVGIPCPDGEHPALTEPSVSPGSEAGADAGRCGGVCLTLPHTSVAMS
jgi:hypothetical protein